MCLLIFVFIHRIEIIYLKIDTVLLAMMSQRPHMKANCSGFRRNCEQRVVNRAGAVAAEAGGLSVRRLLRAEAFRDALWKTCLSSDI